MGWRRHLEVWTDVLYEKYRSWDRCSETLVFLVTVITLGSEPSVKGWQIQESVKFKVLIPTLGKLVGVFCFM